MHKWSIIPTILSHLRPGFGGKHLQRNSNRSLNAKHDGYLLNKVGKEYLLGRMCIILHSFHFLFYPAIYLDLSVITETFIEHYSPQPVAYSTACLQLTTRSHSTEARYLLTSFKLTNLTSDE